jgi:hypothetical protein
MRSRTGLRVAVTGQNEMLVRVIDNAPEVRDTETSGTRH